MRTDRRGFTIVELLVVAVLGSLLLMSIYQILLTNQRTYRENAEQVQGQQTARMALDIVANELRELNVSDITLPQAYGLSYSRMTSFGVVCGIDYGPPVVLTVMKKGRWFEAAEDIVVFADNDPDISDDDAWITADVTGQDTVGIACNGSGAQDLKFTGQDAKFLTDSVRIGAPIRGMQSRRLANGTYNGAKYLMLTEGGQTEPLVGPIASNGLSVQYLDEDGNTTSTAADIYRIVFSVAAADGTSLTTTVYPRN